VGDHLLARAYFAGKLTITSHSKESSEMKNSVLTGVIAIVLGFLLMVPVARLFDAKNWAVFNTWGLAHGSFIFAWPLLAYVSFYLLRMLIPTLWARGQSN
jgi:hypothetical protein